MIKTFFNKQIFGWAMFDFANSSYTTVIITALFSPYFIRTVVDSPQEGLGEYYWGITLSISYFIVALLSPIIGTISDYSSSRKKYLLVTSIICILFTALLFFVTKGDIVLAVVLIILSNIGFSLGENLISSFLPEVSPPGEIGKVSGFGWGIGFIGGIIALVGSIFILRYFGESSLSIRIICIFVAVFFAISIIPTFLWLKEDQQQGKQKNINYLAIAYQRLIETFHHLKDFKELIKLLTAFFIYNAGIAIIISFSANYAKVKYKFDDSNLIFLIILINITASIGAVFFGFIQDQLGAKRTLIITLLLWIGTVIGIYFTQTQTGFWFIASIAGLGLGSIQSATRAMVGLFSPKSKLAEFYGFWGLSGKLSAILGLYTFGYLSSLEGFYEIAILSTLVFFIVGLLLMLTIKEPEGIAHAKNYD